MVRKFLLEDTHNEILFISAYMKMQKFLAALTARNTAMAYKVKAMSHIQLVLVTTLAIIGA